MKPHTLALISLAASMSACGGWPEAASTGGSTSSTITWTQSVEELAAQADVQCDGDGRLCSKAVGQFYGGHAGSTSVSVCTAFMITRELAVTNSHCIPTDLATGNSCAGRLFIKFPRSATLAAAVVGCECVVSKSDMTVTPDEDYAVLRLARSVTEREPLFPSRAPPYAGQALTVLKVTPNGGNAGGGLLESSPCTVNSTLGGDVAAIHLNPCPVVHGNSGSAVVDGRGGVVGIISQSLSAGSNASHEVYDLGAQATLMSWVTY